MKRVGFWLVERKLIKLNFIEFCNSARGDDIDFIKIDLDVALEEQGPFDLILHRFSELVILAEKDEHIQKQVDNINSYRKQHPEVIWIDILENIISLIRRQSQLNVCVRCANHPSLGGQVFVPKFCLVDTTDKEKVLLLLKETGITFPILCKPALAHGKDTAHTMCVIFNEDTISEMPVPCVAQAFLNHNAILHKIYTVGPYAHYRSRSSIKNLYPGDSKPLTFHTHDVSKDNCNSKLSQLDEEDCSIVSPEPDPQILRKISDAFREVSGLELFGIDIIIPNGTNKYGIIDLNAFPGYDEVNNFYEYLESLIREKLNLSFTKVAKAAGDL